MDDIVSCARKIALLNHHRPNWESFRRKICRWYSEKFNTALVIVENDLDFFEVLIHYFESSFADMDPKDLEDQMRQATETEEERIKREQLEDEEEQAFLQMAAEEEEKRLAKDVDYKKLVDKIKKESLIKKTVQEKPDIEIKFEPDLDLDKPSF